MCMTLKQMVNWNSRKSTARSARVPAGLLTGPGVSLVEWVDHGCRTDIQVAADAAVRKLLEPPSSGLSRLLAAALRVRAAPLKKLSTAGRVLQRAWICRSCRCLK